MDLFRGEGFRGQAHQNDSFPVKKPKMHKNTHKINGKPRKSQKAFCGCSRTCVLGWGCHAICEIRILCKGQTSAEVNLVIHI